MAVFAVVLAAAARRHYWAGLAAILVLTVDLVVANSPLVITVPQALFDEQPALDRTWLAFLAGFDIVFLTASWLLCDHLLEE